jgi:hypothetical protein
MENSRDRIIQNLVSGGSESAASKADILCRAENLMDQHRLYGRECGTCGRDIQAKETIERMMLLEILIESERRLPGMKGQGLFYIFKSKSGKENRL